MTFIHETAIVSPQAQLEDNCFIGAFSIVGDNVTLGKNVRLESHVVVDGKTEIGDDTKIFPFVSIGLAPQDLKYADEPTRVEIGKNNYIREFVTVHRGTTGGGGLTKIGDDNLLMAQVHIAHDCQIGNGVVFANAAALAGHVIVGDRVSIGGYSGVHQFCNIGRESFIGAYSLIVKDTMPFALTSGNHARCYGLNRVGLRRRGYSKETIKNLHHAYHLLLNSKLNTTQALERIEAEISGCEEVEFLVRFIKSSTRGVVK